MRWNELDWPLRLTEVVGIVEGAIGFIYYYAFLMVPGIWPVLVVLPPYSLGGSLSILLVPMNKERRWSIRRLRQMPSQSSILPCNFDQSSPSVHAFTNLWYKGVDIRDWAQVASGVTLFKTALMSYFSKVTDKND